MLMRIRERAGSAGLAVAIIALVLAVAGGAYAAGGGLSGKQKKEVKAIAKSFQGTGPQGPQGLAGANGVNGKDGASGVNGVPGAPGKDGNSINMTPLTAGAQIECEETGGALLEDEEPAPTVVELCNGEEGPRGPEGSPWAAGGTLPLSTAPGCPCTETGSWIFVAGESSPWKSAWRSRSRSSCRHRRQTVRKSIRKANQTSKTSRRLGPKQSAARDHRKPAAPSGHLCVYGNVNLTSAKFLLSPIGSRRPGLKQGRGPGHLRTRGDRYRIGWRQLRGDGLSGSPERHPTGAGLGGCHFRERDED